MLSFQKMFGKPILINIGEQIIQYDKSKLIFLSQGTFDVRFSLRAGPVHEELHMFMDDINCSSHAQVLQDWNHNILIGNEVFPANVRIWG